MPSSLVQQEIDYRVYQCALKQLQIISIWKSSCSAVSTLENTHFWADLSKACASFYFPLKPWPYSISGFPFLMDLMQVLQWWPLNPRHFQWVASSWIKGPPCCPSRGHFLGSVCSLWQIHVWTAHGDSWALTSQEHIQLQGKSHNYHSVFAKGLVGEPQEFRKCNCV